MGIEKITDRIAAEAKADYDAVAGSAKQQSERKRKSSKVWKISGGHRCGENYPEEKTGTPLGLFCRDGRLHYRN